MPKKNVLVVDDSPFIREMVCKILDKLGFLSVKASDGDEALVIADRYTPDAFVLDVNMPKMNGLQVLSKLREDERFKDTPIVMLSGVKDEDIVKSSIRGKATGYILKDDPNEVMKRLGSYLADL